MGILDVQLVYIVACLYFCKEYDIRKKRKSEHGDLNNQC